jgi:hypothetical protein
MIVKLCKPYVRVVEVLGVGEHEMDDHHAERAKRFGCVTARRKKVAKRLKTGAPVKIDE